MHECPGCGDTFEATQGLSTHASRWCDEITDSGLEKVSDIISGKDHHMHGTTRCEEYKQMMSEKHSGDGNPMAGKTGEDNPFYGETHDDETIAKIQKGRDFSGSNNPNFRNGAYLKQHCEECGDLYKPNRSGQKYCSMSCMADAFRDPIQTKVCPQCNGIFEPHTADTEYCSVQCSNEAMAVDSDMPTFYWAVRQSISGESWQAIREREVSKQCYKCGNEDRLHVHHIVPVMAGGLNEDWNLMTLCDSCHKSVEYHTKEFTERVLLPNR